MHPKTLLHFASSLSLAVAAIMLSSTTAQAVPSLSRQTGMSCTACHTTIPALTPYGRTFKLGGFTASADETSEFPPFSVMLQPSFTHTQKSQADHEPGFSKNDNFALTQASVFYSGRLFGPYADSLFGPSTASFLNKIGTFIQGTYDGVGKAWSWDNVEFRYADSATLGGKDVAWGIYLNNNPTLQDPWNTLPAWGFPYSGSGLAPTPGAATMIDGAFSQQVYGLGVYAMIDHHVYVDIGGYRTLGTGFQKSMGVDPADEALISGVAPYWRLAYTQTHDKESWEIGTFGMSANTFPGRDKSSGKDRTTDVGFDAEYQNTFGKHGITALASWVYEQQHLNGTLAQEGSSRSHDHLWTARTAVEYLYDKTYGASVGYFLTDGSHDALLHSDSVTGSPKSDGLVFELNYLPFAKSGGMFGWKNSSLKLSLQYVLYNTFNGSHSNYDGAGSKASDNNTLYLQAWFTF